MRGWRDGYVGPAWASICRVRVSPFCRVLSLICNERSFDDIYSGVDVVHWEANEKSSECGW
jgi:hypothetical protein